MRLRFAFLLLLCVVACAPATRPPSAVPDALASFVVWHERPLASSTSLDGSAVDTLDVEPEQLVRLEGIRAPSVEVIESSRTERGIVESRRTEAVQSGVLVARVGAFTTSVGFSRGVVGRGFVGHASEPGVHWIDHARRVVAWAEGPLSERFPDVAPMGRVDGELFERLDKTLAADLAKASDAAWVREAGQALRAIVGLRQLRALEPVTGYPYFLDTPAIGNDVAMAGVLEGHEVHRLEPGKSIEARAKGPAMLSVWAWSDDRGPEHSVTLSVFEGQARRARSTRRLRQTQSGSLSPSSPERLTRAVVHVPPGEHVYRLESDGVLRVAALSAASVLPMDLHARADENALFARAFKACDVAASLAMCRLARALAAPSQTAPSDSAESDDVARLVADLSAGPPHDDGLDRPARSLHERSAQFDKIERDATSTVDELARANWVRAVQRSSVWRPVEPSANDRRWTVALHRDGIAASSASKPEEQEAALVLLGDEPAVVTSSEFHDVAAVDLIWAGTPSGQRVELEVDGQRISAQPHASFTRWHVRVRGEAARVRRTDHGAGQVFAAAPSMRVAAVPAAVTDDALPLVAANAPFARGLGIELWAREDCATVELSLEGVSGEEPHLALRAQGMGTALAIDEAGHVWRRVVRTALPAWVAAGVRVHPREGTAYRAIVREIAEPQSRPPTSEPHDEPARAPSFDAIVALSRQVIEAEGAARAALLRERAMALAERGIRLAAQSDARAAIALGLDAERARTLEADVERIAARATPLPAPLPAGVAAYGIEPDFDDSVSDGAPRASFEHAFAALPRRDVDTAPFFDAERAVSVLSAARAVSLDPRQDRAIHRALAGGRWQTIAGFSPVARERNEAAERDVVVDGDGLLLPRVASGMPFQGGSFVAITAERPSAFRLTPNEVGARYHLDVVCAAAVTDADVAAVCTPRVSVGDDVLEAQAQAAHGRARYELPQVKQPVRVGISLVDAPSRWVAVARLVSDREVPGADLPTQEGWVVSPPHREARPRIEPGRHEVPLRATPSVLRIRAMNEPGEAASVSIEVDGVRHVLVTDGSDLLLPVRSSAAVVVSAGRPFVHIAERIASPGVPHHPNSAAVAVSLAPRTPVAPSIPVAVALASSTTPLVLDGRSIAELSPRPLTRLESNLGTFVLSSGAIVGTLRQGEPSASQASTFGFLSAGYRRRIERLGLWTDVSGFTRQRLDAPATFGGNGVLYEDLEQLHLRLSASLGVESQRVLDGNAVAWLSRGFAEYSYRVTPQFFVLPRFGWDQVAMSLAQRPRVASAIDDEVWNPYRSKRSTFVFAQGLFWWAPYFDEITYLRLRVTSAPSEGTLARASARPGAFALVGPFDLAAYVDAAWMPASQSVRGESRVATSAGFVGRYDDWSRLGSLDVQPGFAFFSHLNDGGWQVNAFVNLFASYRRGLRDFSSLELDFPEGRSDGIPWRGNSPGAYR